MLWYMGGNECCMGVLCFSRAWVRPRQRYILQTRVELVVHTLTDVNSIAGLSEAALCVDGQ